MILGELLKYFSLQTLMSSDAFPSHITCSVFVLRCFVLKCLDVTVAVKVRDSRNGIPHTDHFLSTGKTNSVACSPQANYTDRATVSCWRNLMSTFVDRGVSRGQLFGCPAVVKFGFLDRNRYFSYK
jgi:hypothetical protein